MAERIYTIPINEMFDRAPNECTCPFCLLKRMLEETEIDIILGASMMEPDIRIETNKKGFCSRHFEMMYEKQNRLSLALILESHIDEVKEKLSASFLDKSLQGVQKNAEKIVESCYVCDRIEDKITKMYDTTAYLWGDEKEFKDKFARQKYFCLPHYIKLLEYARHRLSKKQFSELSEVMKNIQNSYMNELKDDVSHFCKKFDYRYDKEPWGNAKDAPERAIRFLAGDASRESLQK